MTDKPRTDVHATITDRIIAQIEAGAGDFRMPWHNKAAPLHRPRNAHTKKLYRGINILSLWGSADGQGFGSNKWGTYKQWQELGAQVRKGAKGSLVVLYKEFHVEPDDKDADDDGRRMFARASWVFNAEQVDGYTDEHTGPDPNNGPIEKIANADRFISATGAIIKHGGKSAFYSPSTDHIQMPDEHLFIGDQARRTESWYSTALHELTHWTGAKKRLDREFGKRFGNDAYAFEELVAELGAAFSCASLGITNEPRTDHAQYIAHWLKILKGDKRAIFTAAAKASAAADYLESLGSQPQQLAA